MADVIPIGSMQPAPNVAAMGAQLSPEPDTEKWDAEAICKEADERFKKCNDDDRDNINNAISDFKFVYSPGEQWDGDVKQRRKNWKEPCLEFNQLKQFVNQVVGDERQNKPAILVHPANGQASKEVAEIEQGMIRNIEYQSQAEAAYDNGFQGAVVGGRGWWRVCTEYVKNSFNQDIFIRPILDPMSVRADMDYQQPDASDRKFAFVMERVKKEEFERRWPDADPVSWDELDEQWKDGKDDIIVVDYYRLVPTKRTLVAMSDGATGYKDELPKTIPAGVSIVREREVETCKLEWHKIAGGQQLLESYKLPGDIIPLVQTCGDDIIIDGKRIYQGLIRPARDAQQMFNFGMTAQAIHLALTPRAPWVAPQEAIDDYKEIWKNANVENYSVLPFKHKDDAGNPIPPPTRTAPSMPDSGWINWCTTMQGMLRSTIGMYQNSLGQQGTETSGRAILAREKQGDTGTFHFVDNQHRAIALTGRIIQQWIPTYYDTQRIVQIIGPDDTRKLVTINQTAPHPTDPLRAIKLNDVTVGEYAVVVEAGPGYATKRQETSEKLMQLVQAFPPAAQVAGDLIVKSLDVADADQIADRLKLMLPPPVQQALQAQQGGGKPPDPATMQKLMQMNQQMQGMGQKLQELTQRNQQLESGFAAKQAQIQADAANAEQERQLKLAGHVQDLAAEREKADREDALKRYVADQEAATARYKAKLDNETKMEIAAMNNVTDIHKVKIQPKPEPRPAQPS